MASAMSVGTVYGLFEVRERVTQIMPRVVRELQQAGTAMTGLGRESILASNGLGRVPPAANDAGNAMSRLASSAGGLKTALASAAGAFAGFLSAHAVLGAVRSVMDKVGGAAIGMNATLETTTLQFTTLMGSADAARAHVQSLFEFAKKTPFETGPIIEASRMLQTFGGAALNTQSTLTLLGDAAAAVNAPINDLGFWVGRLYSNLKGGQPFGEAAMRLQELAVLSPQARQQMEALQKSGADASKVFGVFEQDLKRFTGAMEAQASTWQGVTSTFSDTVNILIGTAFAPLFEAIRDGLRQLNEVLGSDGVAKAVEDFAQTLSQELRAGFLSAGGGAVMFANSLISVLHVVDLAQTAFRALQVVSNRTFEAILNVGRLVVDLALKSVALQRAVNPSAWLFDGWETAARTAQELSAVLEGMAQGFRDHSADAVASSVRWGNSLSHLQARIAGFAKELTSAAQTGAAAVGAAGAGAITAAGAGVRAVGTVAAAVREQLASVAVAIEKAQQAADLRDAKMAMSEFGGELAAVARRFDTVADFATAAAQRIQNVFPREWALQLMNPFGKALSDAQTKGLDLLGTLRNIARAFGDLAAVASGSMSTVLRLLGTAATSASLVGESVGAIKSGWSALKGADGITKSLTKGLASMTAGILGAAAAALQLGAALWDALTKSRAEQTMERIGRDLGLTVTESFAQSIEDRAKQLFGGNRQAARIFSLKGMIDAGGGLTADNFGALIGEFRDLFSMVETGAFTAAQGIQVLDENFKTFADFVTKGGSLARKELLEIIRLSRDMGLNSEAVNAFVNDQLRTALDGFTAFADARSSVVKDLAEARTALDELVKDKAPAAEIEAARRKVTELSQALTALPITAEGALGIGASLAAMFSEGLRQGRPIVDLLREIGPVAEQYAEHFAMAGVTGGEAFEQLRRLAGIASSEISGPAVSAISGLSTALASMHNAGLLNQEMFTGITSQLVSLKAGLEATGVSSGDAMLIMKDGLQTAWELWKDHNYVVDEATKKLLEEAEAAGVVGDEHRTVQEQMLKATLEMRDAVVGLAQVFGVTAVGAVNDFGDAIRNLPDLPSVPDFPDAPVRSPSGAMPDRGMFPDGFTPDLPKHDAGAFVRKDHVAMVHSGEMIGPVSFMSQALEGAFASMRTSGDSDGRGGDTNIYVHAFDAESIERMLADPRKAKAIARSLKTLVAARDGEGMALEAALWSAGKVARR